MLSAEESAELRMLHAKAYGRDGGLTAAEFERLRELEASGGRTRLPSVTHPVSATAAPQPALKAPQDPARVVERAEGETKRAERATAGRSGSSPDETPHAETRRRHPLFFAALAGIALVVGFGIGWRIWGWDAGTYALATAHADQRTELEASDDFDPGTVAPLAEQYGVVVWRAERSEGDEVCVIVTGPDQMIGHGCIPSEQLKDSVWPNASATVPEGQEKAGQQLVAGLIPTATGELVPFIQVWDQDASLDWESQYSDAELAQLREIEAAGYDGSTLGIVGYDGDTVVWSSWASSGFCVIAAVDGGPIEACSRDAESEITLIATVDGIPTEYVVRQSEMRAPQLTVIRHPDAAVVEVDPETGDPIEFTFDDPMFDDLVSDGETDETGG